MNSTLSNVELAIKTVLLRGKAKELRSLAEKINSKNFTVSFQQGTGSLVNEFMNTAQELKNVGDALSQLCNITAIRVEDAVNQFEFSDDTLANQFQKCIASIGGRE